MSGHSHMHNILAKKGKTDAARAKVFTRISKEMAIAIRAGGPNPASNSKLTAVIAKAKAANMPNDNIQRIINKYSESKDNNYEEIVYEGYGPGGVAVIVETATDNRNRTAGNIRSYFSKYHGNMGQTGCVSYMFEEKGSIVIVDEDGDVDEDKLMETALEAGATDLQRDEEIYQIYTETDDLQAVAEDLRNAGYTLSQVQAAKVPSTYTELDDEESRKFMELLLEKLDDDDDVTEVYHNWQD